MDIVHQSASLGGLWNSLSILLGLVAIGFGIHSFSVKGCLTCCTISLGACGASLLFQLMEVDRLANSNDWSAIQDTIHARVITAAALLSCILAVNLFALYRSKKVKTEDSVSKTG